MTQSLLTSAQRFARPKDGQDSYTYDGRDFVRVTSVLGTVAEEHLFAWYAQESARESALKLMAAGVVGTPELQKAADSRPPRILSMDEAHAAVLDFKDSAKAPYRYRDSKARIGSAAHHYAYAVCLGESIPNPLEFLHSYALGHDIFPAEVLERFQAFGKTHEDLAKDLAFRALPYCQSWRGWLDAFRPDFWGAGLEAFVAHESEEFAGTCDAWITVRRKDWPKSAPWEWAKDEALLMVDYKTSNSLSKDVVCQLAAYAHATGIVHEKSGDILPLPPVDGVMAVHLQESGLPAKVQAWSDPAAIKEAYEFGFLPLLERWRWSHNRPQPIKSRRARQSEATKTPSKADVRACPF